MGEENPAGVLEQLVNRGHVETGEDAGKETHIEGEDVDVVCGAPALAISKFELQVFIFSDFPGTGLEGQTLSECVFDTARPPQCEFSNLHSSLAFGLLE